MCYFSVIVPVYNAENYIDRCANSIINQTFQDFELLLIDDMSQDNSKALCEDLCRKDERIHYELIPHGGSSAARNRGLELAKGNYCVFVDSDDYLAEETLEHIYETVAVDTPDICYMCKHYAVEEGKEPVINHVFQLQEEEYKKPVTPEKFLKIITTEGNHMPGSSCVVIANMDVVRENQVRFDSKLIWSEDTDFSFQLFIAANSISWCDFCGYYYDIGNVQSVSKKITWNKAIGRMQVYKKWSEYFMNSSEAEREYTKECRDRIVQQLLTQYCSILFLYTELPTREEVLKMRSVLKKEYKFWKQCQDVIYKDYVVWGLTFGTIIHKVKSVIRRIV